QDRTENRQDAATRRHCLMSFRGMGKSIRMIGAPTHNADAPAHHSHEFPAGYSLTSCSPAELVSASPARVEYDSMLGQLWGIFNHQRSRIDNLTPAAIHQFGPCFLSKEWGVPHCVFTAQKMKSHDSFLFLAKRKRNGAVHLYF